MSDPGFSAVRAVRAEGARDFDFRQHSHVHIIDHHQGDPNV